MRKRARLYAGPLSWLRFHVLVVVLFLFPASACAFLSGDSPEAGALNLYNWENYIASGVLETFQQETGVEVTVTTFSSEEEAMAAVQAAPGRFDLVAASGSTLQTLLSLKLLAVIERSRLPNLKNLDDEFRSLPFDPEGRYSVPYLWGTTGVAVNTAHASSTELSWAVLGDPAYAGHTSLLDDPQEAFSAALKSLGASGNSSDAPALEQASQRLGQWADNGLRFLNPTETIDLLAAGDLWAAQAYNGDALVASQGNADVRYALPQEGPLLWIDNWVMPVDAPNKADAYKFLDYLLRTDVMVLNSQELFYASPSSAARALVKPEVAMDPAVYVPEELLAQGEFYAERSVEANRFINRAWADLRRTGD